MMSWAKSYSPQMTDRIAQQAADQCVTDTLTAKAPRMSVQAGHGEEDFVPIGGAREWAAHLRDARLLAIPNCGHFPWLEAPG
jgi:pimeloyl-ACP methyl ester carboxylesterase